jgi:cell division septation protein DedD
VRPPALLLAALVLAACGRSDRRSSSEPGARPVASRGPDPVVLRVPRSGGRVAAALYPNLDSVVWRSREAAPALARVLGFDVESGLLAAVDTAGRPMRVDLRLGTVGSASRTPLTALASVGGGTFFGLSADGAVTRLTPSGSAWKLPLRGGAQELFPQRDGSVLAAGVRDGAGYVWRLRPPMTQASDSVAVPNGTRAIRTGTSDRVYFAAGTELAGVRSRDLEPVRAVTLPAALRLAMSTPSGDRIYVATETPGELAVIDRFRELVATTLTLPGEIRELRMDPLGRYLLVRPTRGDSAWVVAVGAGRVIGSLPGSWRDDLPLVLPDGAIASATGADVTIAEAESLQPRRTIAGGASDLWHVVFWNGFRPRAAGLDQPVTFGGGESATDEAVPTDSVPPPDTAAPPPDTTTAPTPPETTTVTRPIRPTVPSAGEVALPPGRGYTVQFVAAETERDARSVARRLSVDGAPLRVVPAQRGGRTVYRVVTGPYATRAAAERVARTTASDFWVFEGVP